VVPSQVCYIPVLTAVLHCINGNISFLWKRPKFDPPYFKTPEQIGIKFGTVD